MVPVPAVLVVERNGALRDMMVHVLQEQGFEVLAASDAADALAALDRGICASRRLPPGAFPATRLT